MPFISSLPYRHASTWVFDDPRVGLSQEPFVSGIPEMIDIIVADIPNAEKGFRLLFASAPFPGYQVKLEKVREEYEGVWYRWTDNGGGLALSGALSVFSRSADSSLRQSGGPVVGSRKSVPESRFCRLHYVGCSPRVYPVNVYSIIARRLRRSVLVMIIPLHIVSRELFPVG